MSDAVSLAASGQGLELVGCSGERLSYFAAEQHVTSTRMNDGQRLAETSLIDYLAIHVACKYPTFVLGINDYETRFLGFREGEADAEQTVGAALAPGDAGADRAARRCFAGAVGGDRFDVDRMADSERHEHAHFQPVGARLGDGWRISPLGAAAPFVSESDLAARSVPGS